MQRTNPKVDVFLNEAGKWRSAFAELRRMLLASELTEVWKWGVPCYTYQAKNVVLMHGFKEYCALLFVKGALLKDAGGMLVQQTENVQAGRQLRFTDVRDIIRMESAVKAYVDEAIEVEKAGLTVRFMDSSEIVYAEEFQRKLAENPVLKTAFEALTPGRKRAYHLYFSAPKQSKTRETRIAKCLSEDSEWTRIG